MVIGSGKNLKGHLRQPGGMLMNIEETQMFGELGLPRNDADLLVIEPRERIDFLRIDSNDEFVSILRRTNVKINDDVMTTRQPRSEIGWKGRLIATGRSRRATRNGFTSHNAKILDVCRSVRSISIPTSSASSRTPASIN